MNELDSILEAKYNSEKVDQIVKQLNHLPDFSVTNIVVSGSLTCKKIYLKKIDLQKETLFTNCKNEWKYLPKKFIAATIRLDEEACTVQLFPNGKFIALGGRDENQIISTVIHLIIFLSNFQNDPNITLKQIKIVNICTAIKLPYKIDLVKMYMAKEFPIQLYWELSANAKFYYKKLCFTICRNGIIYGCGGTNLDEYTKMYTFLKKKTFLFKK